jgi:cysteine-rich repeat protein
MKKWIVLAFSMLACACDGEECAFNSDCPTGSFCREGACTSECSDEEPCPSGQLCSPFGLCEASDAGSTPDASIPRDAGPECGDGNVEGQEECDDANGVAGDGCEPGCTWTCETASDCADDPCDGPDACVDHVCATSGEALPVGSACDTASVIAGVCRRERCVPRCDPTAPFTSIEPMADLDTEATEAHPKLSVDELTVYFGSDRPGSLGQIDIFTATRASVDEPFGEAVPVAGVNTEGWEGNPSITGDGLYLYARARGGPEGEEIVVATRSSIAESFGAFTSVPFVNREGGNDYCPYVMPDHSQLWFVSDRAGQATNVFHVRRNTSGTFNSEIDAVTPVNSDFTEDIVVVTPDELTIYFDTTRPEGINVDAWYATRENAVSLPFSNVAPIESINTERPEWPSWISPDGCELLYTSTSDAGDYDMYRATRSP